MYDAVLGEVLGRILTQEGHIVRQALTASIALDLDQGLVAAAAPSSDACLRDGTGLKLAEDIRARFPGLPIILFTAYPASGAHISRMGSGTFAQQIDQFARLAASRVDGIGQRGKAATSAAVATPVEVQNASPPLESTNLNPADSSPRRTVKEWSIRLFSVKDPSRRPPDLSFCSCWPLSAWQRSVRRPVVPTLRKGKAEDRSRWSDRGRQTG